MVIKSNCKKIEVLVDEPLWRRVREKAMEVASEGYTLQPTLGGEGARGRWFDDQVTGGAGSKVIFTTVLDDDAAGRFLDALEPLLETYGLMVTVSSVEVIRAATE
ncbi:P-II family nitrogen regulator [Hoeflea sp.]|uniref:P-II family nitrogen regulator n=1 Tax=Hoeflea sp. TaxID=1940281 RepID=UPI003B02660E